MIPRFKRIHGGITLLLFVICIICNGNAQKKNDMIVKVHEVNVANSNDLDEVSRVLEQNSELNFVDISNWPNFSYKPEVKFRIAHNNMAVFLKFYVTEENILAKKTETNSATHRDSCLEFFIDTKKDGNYYNFEFNGIGVTHLAYGPSIKERTFIDANVIENDIKIRSSLGDKPFDEKKGGHSWELVVAIPVSLFTYDKGLTLKGLKANANFYKCGDDTSVPHYLSWNPIKTDRPSFHQPDFFGELIFE